MVTVKETRLCDLSGEIDFWIYHIKEHPTGIISQLDRVFYRTWTKFLDSLAAFSL